MNLWIFGCSFSVGSTCKDTILWKYEKNWIDYLSDRLGISNIKNFSQFGVSNEYIFKKFGENFHNFRKGDVVIVQSTSAVRKWFFEDRPELSNITRMKKGVFDKESENALKSYFTYLQNSNLDDLLYTQWLYAVSYFIHSKPDVKFVILPGFGDAPASQGCLQNVCENEFSKPDIMTKFYDINHWDPRINHLTNENHKILANKLSDYILEKANIIDLENGFVKSIYNENYLGEDNEYFE